VNLVKKIQSVHKQKQTKKKATKKKRIGERERERESLKGHACPWLTID
jgi:hypothetical protein